MTDKKSVLESITIEDEDEEIEEGKQNNLQDTLREIGNELFKKHPRKKSNISRNNTIGMIQCEVLNEYMDINFGYRYKTLDVLIECARDYPLSVNGFGLEKYIEGIKSIQATFEQTELPSRIKDMLR